MSTTPTHSPEDSGGCLPRFVRVPWSAEEDESIKQTYAMANGGFPTYAQQAAQINHTFHGGRPIRSASAVRRRECKLLSLQ